MASAGVVVSASGPSAASYPVGKSIGNSERIALRAGDTLTVLDGNGTRVLRGAGTYTLDQQGGASQRGAFAALTQRRTASQVRTGAIRGEQEMRPPNLWYVDVSHPGTVCVPAVDRVRLWRPVKEGEATVTLRANAGGASHSLTFGDGATLATWDTAAFPIADGASFGLSGPEGAAGTLTFVLLDTAAEEPEALAQQLIQKGCTQQLELLSTTTMIVDG
ncbi:MAG TPA: hypothetical protein VI168_14285 [Croceibacterium sp.]